MARWPWRFRYTESRVGHTPNPSKFFLIFRAATDGAVAWRFRYAEPRASHTPNPSKFFLIFAARTAASASRSSSSAWISRSAVLKSKLSSSSSGATPT